MSTQFITKLNTQGLLPLFFHKDGEICCSILTALYKAGIRIVEFTNRGEEALANFGLMKAFRDRNMPDLILAAGTIKTREHAIAYISEGADFIISPGMNEEVAEAANANNTFWVPGCMTPSEIMLAERKGAKLVKLFPANLLGPAFVDSIKELFPSLSFLPTGGVSMQKDNLSAWYKSGVIAVGAGSTLINKKSIEASDFSAIEQAAKAALLLVSESRTFHKP
jgi:2-dehydro-3-deoxyphosphogluconate aldolase/(4S)-4-hydroxy-2-oxoglutarate aldolase